jgi:hypothetical protein
MNFSPMWGELDKSTDKNYQSSEGKNDKILEHIQIPLPWLHFEIPVIENKVMMTLTWLLKVK